MIKRSFNIPAVFLLLLSGVSAAQSYELDPVNKKDTINLIDFKGMKQRQWIIYGKNKPDTCFARTSKVEEGLYADNRKKGTWTSYFCSGSVYRKVNFQNGRPDGYAIFYHENGKTAEEGTWKGNKWMGAYKTYYPNGNTQSEFTFNQAGKREGAQKYYYPDGKTQIEGNWQNGKENGVVTEYHPDGSVKKTVNYNNGNADVASIKEFKATTVIATKPEVTSAKQITASKEELNQDKKPAMLNGYHLLYNASRQKTKEGVFKDNRLMEGKNYIYDENGILRTVEIYKNGVFAGTSAD